MKILLPYCNFKMDDRVITGGIESFARKIFEEYENVFPIDLTPLKIKYKSRELIDKCNQLIKISALKYNVDIIVNNWHSAKFVGAGMVNSSIPILHIEHTNYKVMSCFKVFKRITENNHSIFLVSEFQKNYYESFAKRINAPLPKFSGYVEPAFLDGVKPKLLDEPEFDCVTIGRCDPQGKMPYRLKTMLKDTDFKTLLMTNPPTDAQKKMWGDDKLFKRRYNYYQKNKHWKNCLFNLPHNDVLKNLLRGKTFFTHLLV